MKRRVFIITAVVWAISAPAWAGGTSLELDQDSYQPGQHAVATARVSQGQLGWIDDGPFHAYLGESHTVPSTGSTHLGELQLDPISDGTVVVTLEFVVPSVTPGDHAIVYCNDPCTEGLGDLIGGQITVTAATLPLTGAHLGLAAAVAVVLAAVGLSTLELSRDHSTRPRT